MTPDFIRALLDAAGAATPGPWEWDGNVWDYNPEQEAPWLMSPAPRRPIIQGEVNCSFANATYIAAASPDVVAHLCRIALAAVNMTENGIVKEYRPLRAALRDTGLI